MIGRQGGLVSSLLILDEHESNGGVQLFWYPPAGMVCFQRSAASVAGGTGKGGDPAGETPSSPKALVQLWPQVVLTSRNPVSKKFQIVASMMIIENAHSSIYT